MEKRKLLDWLDAPDSKTGLRFLQESGDWELTDYGALAGLARSVASDLKRLPLPTGGIVAIIIPSGPSFVASFFGSLFAGGTPSPLVPPVLFQDAEQYVSELSGILKAAGPSAVLTEPDIEPLVRRAAEASGVDAPILEPSFEGLSDDGRGDLAELALLQFTSGSSGRPRGVRVSYENLEDNIDIMRRWVDFRPGSRTASWLPLYHDMGLIGALLTTVVSQTDAWIMRPDQFVRDPAKWLEPFGRFGADVTACPNFGFGFICKRVKPEQLEGMDFSNWRSAIVGAERLDTGTLGRFLDLVEPFGFKRGTIVPAYGMAEATLAVTGGLPGSVAEAARLDWRSLVPDGPVEILERAPLGHSATKRSGDWLVSCGSPHRGFEVDICSEEGEVLPPGYLGQIRLRGPSVAGGYKGGETSRSTSFEPDGLHTGDAGFMLDDELYVIGRMGDSLKIKARNVYSEDLEARLWDIEGVPRGRSVVLASPDAEATKIIALVEAEPTGWEEQVALVLRGQVGDEIHIEVMTGERGTILRTSSGKPRRRIMWGRLVGGELQAEKVGDWPPGSLIEGVDQPATSS